MAHPGEGQLMSVVSFAKKISVGKEARDAIYKGVKTLTDLVGSTLRTGWTFHLYQADAAPHGCALSHQGR